VGGNQTLYIKLLNEFFNRYAGAAIQLNELLNNDSFDAAQRLVHTLRSSAGTLGAMKLEETACSIDDNLRSNAVVSKDQLDAFNLASNELFQSLSDWLPDQKA
jgi:HPt (histidine-containing phosphotransfer) domain-containing protein